MTVVSSTHVWREVAHALRYYVTNNNPSGKSAEQAWIEDIEGGIKETERTVDVLLSAGGLLVNREA